MKQMFFGKKSRPKSRFLQKKKKKKKITKFSKILIYAINIQRFRYLSILGIKWIIRENECQK